MTRNKLYIGLVSDLHLDHQEFKEELEYGEVLLLPGDLIPAVKLHELFPEHNLMQDRFNKLLDEACSKFDHVVYTMGNHEHDYGIFDFTKPLLEKELSGRDNIHFLEKNVININGLNIYGACLWTDFNHSFDDMLAATSMPEYHCVKKVHHDTGQLRNLAIGDIYNDHLEACKHLEDALNTHAGQPMIVLSHHLPSYQSVHPKFMAKGFASLNPAYASSLERFMGNDSNILLWAHGHTHDSFDYKINNTRILCNPRGYGPRVLNKRFDSRMIIPLEY